MRVIFNIFFTFYMGVKDFFLPEIYRWLNLVKSIFSNFFGQKTIFWTVCLSLTTQSNHFQFFIEVVMVEKERDGSKIVFLSKKIRKNAFH